MLLVYVACTNFRKPYSLYDKDELPFMFLVFFYYALLCLKQSYGYQAVIHTTIGFAKGLSVTFLLARHHAGYEQPLDRVH